MIVEDSLFTPEEKKLFTDDENIKKSVDKPVVKNNLRIRKLTPRECMRLMGVKDKDSDKMTVSNAQKYKQAGNSIVVSVLMGIFGELLGIEYEDKIQALAKEVSENR